MAVAAVAPLGVLLQAGFQVSSQLGQGGLVAGLLGEGVVEGGQFAALEVQQGDFKGGCAPGGVLLGVGLGEGAAHGAGLARGQAQDSLHEAGDHAALLQLHLHAVAAAALDRGTGVGEAAAEGDAGHVPAGGGAPLHGHQGGELAAGLFQQLIHPGRVVSHRLGLNLQPLGGL